MPRPVKILTKYDREEARRIVRNALRKSLPPFPAARPVETVDAVESALKDVLPGYHVRVAIDPISNLLPAGALPGAGSECPTSPSSLPQTRLPRSASAANPPGGVPAGSRIGFQSAGGSSVKGRAPSQTHPESFPMAPSEPAHLPGALPPESAQHRTAPTHSAPLASRKV